MDASVSAAHPAARSPVSFAEAFRFWLKLGFISFGGPAGQIAIMHQELVERRRWISEKRFLHALNYCMVLPGPEAQHAVVERVQEAPLRDPAETLHQLAVHDRDLPRRPAEADEAETPPEA